MIKSYKGTTHQTTQVLPVISVSPAPTQKKRELQFALCVHLDTLTRFQALKTANLVLWDTNRYLMCTLIARFADNNISLGGGGFVQILIIIITILFLYSQKQGLLNARSVLRERIPILLGVTTVCLVLEELIKTNKVRELIKTNKICEWTNFGYQYKRFIAKAGLKQI